jgi:hypothetical protein
MTHPIMHRLEQFWSDRMSPYPIAAFRVLLGMYLFIYFISLLPHVTLFFSNEGVYMPFLVPDIAPSPPVAWLLYGLTLALITAFTLGWRTRVVTPLLLGAFLYHYLLNLAVNNTAYDRLIILFLLMMCFACSDLVWSVAARRNQTAFSNGEPTVSAWPTRLIGLQVALLYLGSGLYKLAHPIWHSGDIMSQTLTGPWGTPVAFWFAGFGWPGGLYTLLAWGVIAFECLCGFMFYVKPVRRYFLGLGMVFHLSIWLMLNIPQFMVCVCAYVTLVEGDTLRRAVTHLIKPAATDKLAQETTTGGAQP